MILDARGNEWRQRRPIGFHGNDKIQSDPVAELRPDRGYLPDWVSNERSDEPVAARTKRGT